MKLKLISERDVCKNGRAMIDYFRHDDFVKVYSSGVCIEIPLGQTEEFLDYLNKKSNGNGSINFSVEKHKIKIPKSKLEKLSVFLKEIEEIGKKEIPHRMTKYHQEF